MNNKQRDNIQTKDKLETKKSGIIKRKIILYWVVSFILCICTGVVLIYVFNKSGNEKQAKKEKQTNEMAEEMRGENVSADVDDYMQSLQEEYSAAGSDETNQKDAEEKGYNLLVDSKEEKKAKADCTKVMELAWEKYQSGVQGDGDEKLIDEKSQLEIEEILSKAGYTVCLSSGANDMTNYEAFEKFLDEAAKKKKTEAVIYQVKKSGEVDRLLFQYDKKDMYLLWSACDWSDEKKIEVVTNYTRIESWEYSEKGWFMYTLCVPETPEVMEAVNGDAIIRIKPMNASYRELVTKYFSVIGYQGNNIFLTDWNQRNVGDLDLAAVFEYFYQIENGKQLDDSKYEPGINRAEFDTLIQKYLPFSLKQIAKNTRMNKKKTQYLWECLGCGNYDVDDFGMSFPEVVAQRENADGSVTYTIDAVCDQLRTDRALSHELTVQFDKKGRIHFLGNKVLYRGDSVTQYKNRVE